MLFFRHNFCNLQSNKANFYWILISARLRVVYIFHAHTFCSTHKCAASLLRENLIWNEIVVFNRYEICLPRTYADGNFNVFPRVCRRMWDTKRSLPPSAKLWWHGERKRAKKIVSTRNWNYISQEFSIVIVLSVVLCALVADINMENI